MNTFKAKLLFFKLTIFSFHLRLLPHILWQITDMVACSFHKKNKQISFTFIMNSCTFLYCFTQFTFYTCIPEQQEHRCMNQQTTTIIHTHTQILINVQNPYRCSLWGSYKKSKKHFINNVMERKNTHTKMKSSM